MLFNSQIFIFAFLPVVLLGYGVLGHFGGIRARTLTALWLIAASLFFYGWWNPHYLILLIASTCVNFLVGRALRTNPSKWILTSGLAFNILILCYFKYAHFLSVNFLQPFGVQGVADQIILPLAISFFTFQKIAYLVDCYRGQVSDGNFLRFGLFVSFFPQLIAGPIVHHKEIMPQFKNNPVGLSWSHIAVGLTIFAAGLFKKVVMADGISHYASPVFDAAGAGHTLTFLEAWGAALSYTLQIYFDFSGYSDMAIGLARMFGIVLPINFFSPYKATSIIEFWRRWHITLSRFLRDYLYIPLGGNRHGNIMRYRNLIITMLLGGLWHGAAWNFVVWGGLHGAYLAINHMWRDFGGGRRLSVVPAWVLTFLAVVVAWVFFRADTMDTALSIVRSMVGMNGFVLPDTYQHYLNALGGAGNVLASHGVVFREMLYFYGFPQIVFTALLLGIAILTPSLMTMLRNQNPVLWSSGYDLADSRVVWHFGIIGALAVAVIAAIGLLSINTPNEFLYFNF